eukprot:SAG22_NODE_1162_length_5301_cov_1.628604_7_plen_185_part_00
MTAGHGCQRQEVLIYSLRITAHEQGRLPPMVLGNPKLRWGRLSVLLQVRTKALPFCCASTVFLSKTVPFRAVCLSGSAPVRADQRDLVRRACKPSPPGAFGNPGHSAPTAACNPSSLRKVPWLVGWLVACGVFLDRTTGATRARSTPTRRLPTRPRTPKPGTSRSPGTPRRILRCSAGSSRPSG